MKRSFLFILLTSALFTGCGSSSSTNSVYQNPHAAPHQEMHDSKISEEIEKSEKEIETPVTQRDIENAKSDHPKSDFYAKKWKDGIIFYAGGNEPFWSLNIDKKNKVKFETLDGIEYSSSYVSKLPSIDLKSVAYRLSDDTGEMIINLIEEKFMDTMADEEFSFSVKIDLKLKGEKSFTTFKGCGDYVPDPRLHGKWIVVKADTLNISKDQFNHKQPELNFDVYQRNVSGNDGCNLFNGGVSFREHEIIFGMMAGTMMACPNMDISSLITRSFTDKTLNYKFKNQLIFFEGDREVLVLKRDDN